MTKFYVWITEANGRGTCHVSSHEADTPDEATNEALYETCVDWGGDYIPTDLRILGIAKGEIEIIEWDDL
jgi:hypothetical protein